MSGEISEANDAMYWLINITHDAALLPIMQSSATHILFSIRCRSCFMDLKYQQQQQQINKSWFCDQTTFYRSNN